MPLLKTPWRIAHRGYHARCVENTLEAFAAAYRLGCDMVEFDVQLSADGIPIIFHDDDLMRLAHRSDSIFQTNADQLCAIALSNGPTPIYGSIPSLEEFLAIYGAKPFYLEIKIPAEKAETSDYCKALVQKILSLLAAAPRHANTFVASFHPEVVREVLQAGYMRAACIHETLSSFKEACQSTADDALSKRILDSLSLEVYTEALAAGMEVDTAKTVLWNVKTHEGFATAVNQNVAGVVADNVPELLRAIP